MRRTFFFAIVAVTISGGAALAQEPRRGPRAEIVLGPDDKPAFEAPPAGFDLPREGIDHGKVETIQYDSKTVGNKRNLVVYRPPGHSPDEEYNVLYLLHGIGGDETEWRRACAAETILDNLNTDGKLEPMIVVFPNGRAQPNDRAEGNVFAHAKAFETFTDDLLNDVVPFVEAHYPVKTKSENRALAGLSMGGGQSLNIGLKHLDKFAWIGGFSSAPNTKPPAELVPSADDAARLKLLYLSCGDQDGLIGISQNLHAQLKTAEIPHVWHVNSGGHNGEVWKRDLYHFSQLLFR